MKEINTDDFVDELCEIDPNYKKEIKELEKKFNCLISCSIEKHNVTVDGEYCWEVMTYRLTSL